MLPCRPLTVVLPLFAAAAAGLSACSGEISVGKPDELSGADVARELRAEYEESERGARITLSALTCEEVAAERGAPIRCTGRNSKEIDLELTGEITTVDGDGFDYTWRVARAFAPGTLFSDPLRPQVERVLRRPVREIRCPVRVLVRQDGRFACTVALTEQARLVVDVRQTDGGGSFTWRIRRGSGELDA